MHPFAPLWTCQSFVNLIHIGIAITFCQKWWYGMLRKGAWPNGGSLKLGMHLPEVIVCYIIRFFDHHKIYIEHIWWIIKELIRFMYSIVKSLHVFITYLFDNSNTSIMWLFLLSWQATFVWHYLDNRIPNWMYDFLVITLAMSIL